MIFEEKQISSQLIYEGKILNVRRDKVTAKKGESTREIVEHNGAVAMVAITEENHVLQQVKSSLRRVLRSRQKDDKGETDSAESGSQRARYRPDIRRSTFTSGKIIPAVGYSEEVIYLYAMTDLDSESRI